RARKFAADNQLLLVAARHGRGQRGGTAHADPVAFDQRSCETLHRGPLQERTAGKAGTVVTTGIGVLGDRRTESQSHALPVFRNIAHAEPAYTGHVEAVDAFAGKL